MKAVFLVVLFSVCAFAQSQSPSLTSACGPDKVTFDAEEASTPITPALPASGKGLVYFIQDDGLYGDQQHYTLKIGLDGSWVGAYRDNAVFALNVDPGEHHICVNVQSKFDPGHLFAFAHFTVEPGKVYYFRTRFLGEIYRTSTSINIDQPDSDEAKYLIATYPASISKPAGSSKPDPSQRPSNN